MFGEGFNPTPEEYAQAVIMTALFRNLPQASRQKPQSTKPDGYEYVKIDSRKGINIVRAKQKTDPSYKPEIIDNTGKVFTVESIR